VRLHDEVEICFLQGLEDLKGIAAQKIKLEKEEAVIKADIEESIKTSTATAAQELDKAIHGIRMDRLYQKKII
jgi:hypothetical protein